MSHTEHAWIDRSDTGMVDQRDDTRGTRAGFGSEQGAPGADPETIPVNGGNMDRRSRHNVYKPTEDDFQTEHKADEEHEGVGRPPEIR